MGENKIVNDDKIRGLKIANIVFSVLAVVALVVATAVFGCAVDVANTPTSDSGEELGVGLGFALMLVVYIAVGIVGAVLAVVGAGISLAHFKQRKSEALAHLLLSIAIMLTIAVMLIILLMIK